MVWVCITPKLLSNLMPDAVNLRLAGFFKERLHCLESLKHHDAACLGSHSGTKWPNSTNSKKKKHSNKIRTYPDTTCMVFTYIYHKNETHVGIDIPYIEHLGFHNFISRISKGDILASVRKQAKHTWINFITFPYHPWDDCIFTYIFLVVFNGKIWFSCR